MHIRYFSCNDAFEVRFGYLVLFHTVKCVPKLYRAVFQFISMLGMLYFWERFRTFLLVFLYYVVNEATYQNA